MKNRLFITLCLLVVSSALFAQQLSSFTATMQTTEKLYLSIANRQAYTEDEAAKVKSAIDFALVFTKDAVSPKLEWYNLSGKDGKVPEKLTGTSAKISAISFDREQFDKCKTIQDLQRMTGHITPNSFSHFAVISHTKNEINQHCFIAVTTSGKRTLIWISKVTDDHYNVEIKQQP
jgi:hypothetical protein